MLKQSTASSVATEVLKESGLAQAEEVVRPAARVNPFAKRAAEALAAQSITTEENLNRGRQNPFRTAHENKEKQEKVLDVKQLIEASKRGEDVESIIKAKIGCEAGCGGCPNKDVCGVTKLADASKEEKDKLNNNMASAMAALREEQGQSTYQLPQSSVSQPKLAEAGISQKQSADKVSAELSEKLHKEVPAAAETQNVRIQKEEESRAQAARSPVQEVKIERVPSIEVKSSPELPKEVTREIKQTTQEAVVKEKLQTESKPVAEAKPSSYIESKPIEALRAMQAQPTPLNSVVLEKDSPKIAPTPHQEVRITTTEAPREEAKFIKTPPSLHAEHRVEVREVKNVSVESPSRSQGITTKQENALESKREVSSVAPQNSPRSTTAISQVTSDSPRVLFSRLIANELKGSAQGERSVSRETPEATSRPGRREDLQKNVTLGGRTVGGERGVALQTEKYAPRSNSQISPEKKVSSRLNDSSPARAVEKRVQRRITSSHETMTVHRQAERGALQRKVNGMGIPGRDLAVSKERLSLKSSLAERVNKLQALAQKLGLKLSIDSSVQREIKLKSTLKAGLGLREKDKSASKERKDRIERSSEIKKHTDARLEKALRTKGETKIHVRMDRKLSKELSGNPEMRKMLISRRALSLTGEISRRILVEAARLQDADLKAKIIAEVIKRFGEGAEEQHLERAISLLDLLKGMRKGRASSHLISRLEERLRKLKGASSSAPPVQETSTGKAGAKVGSQKKQETDKNAAGGPKTSLDVFLNKVDDSKKPKDAKTPKDESVEAYTH